MHDAVIADRSGVPAAGLMTTKFESAAEMMARVLGAEDYSFVVVDHPISSASVEELGWRAEVAVAKSVSILIGSN